MKITQDRLHQAATASCRIVWKAMYGGSWDTDCPAKDTWIQEEIDALLPALNALGIEVEEAE